MPDRIHQRIFATAARRPDQPAVVGADGALTYRALRSSAAAIAAAVTGAGAAPGDNVALLMDRRAATVGAMLGVLEAGAAYVPVDPAWPAERVAFVLEDAGATVAVVDKSAADHSLPIPAVEVDAPAAVPAAAPQPAWPGSTAYVIFTSGSTGRPKGVAVTHANVVNLLDSICPALGVDASARALATSSFGFDVSVLEVFGPLFAGGTVIMASDADRRDPILLRDLATRHAVTLVQATPTVWEALLDSGFAPPDGATLVTAGEPLRAGLLRRMVTAGDVWNLYGPTETTVYATGRLFPRGEAVPEGDPPIGDPVAGAILHVADGQLRPVPDGAVGELYVGGPGVASRYLDRPRLTADRFLPAPGGRGERAYRTGDLVRRTPSGELVFVGRADRQIKVRGHRVEPEEVEAALAEHPAVAAAAVTVWAPPAGEQMMVAYAGAGPGPRPHVSQLREYLATRLPSYMVPSRIVVIERMPVMANGKIDRASLNGDPAAVERSTEARQWLADLWTELLAVEDVDPDDNFFELGGHSLTAMRVAARVEERFDVRVPLTDIMRNPTVRQLADAITARL